MRIPDRFTADEVAMQSALARYDYSNDIAGWDGGGIYEEEEEDDDDLRDRYED